MDGVRFLLDLTILLFVAKALQLFVHIDETQEPSRTFDLYIILQERN